jgi:hypothetical protein
MTIGCRYCNEDARTLDMWDCRSQREKLKKLVEMMKSAWEIDIKTVFMRAGVFVGFYFIPGKRRAMWTLCEVCEEMLEI